MKSQSHRIYRISRSKFRVNILRSSIAAKYALRASIITSRLVNFGTISLSFIPHFAWPTQAHPMGLASVEDLTVSHRVLARPRQIASNKAGNANYQPLGYTLLFDLSQFFAPLTEILCIAVCPAWCLQILKRDDNSHLSCPVSSF